MDEILQRAHKHVLKSNRLHSALPSPPFQNAKTIREKLVRSKLKKNYKDAATNTCFHSYCDICKILESGDQFESAMIKKK